MSLAEEVKMKLCENEELRETIKHAEHEIETLNNVISHLDVEIIELKDKLKQQEKNISIIRPFNEGCDKQLIELLGIKIAALLNDPKYIHYLETLKFCEKMGVTIWDGYTYTSEDLIENATVILGKCGYGDHFLLLKDGRNEDIFRIANVRHSKTIPVIGGRPGQMQTPMWRQIEGLENVEQWLIKAGKIFSND